MNKNIVEKRRVVVTGMGAITPVGNTVNDMWKNIRDGVCGIDKITKFSLEGFKGTLAAEIKDFNPENYFEKKEAKRMDLFSQYAMAAADMVMKDSGFDPETLEDKTRFGVIIGAGIGGLATLEEQITKLENKGPSRVSPLFIPMSISNMASGLVAIKVGAQGVCYCVTTACASGTNAIGEAYKNIQYGHADAIITGGAEATITRSGVAGFVNLSAMTTASDPNRASIPFDKDRSGFVMGEGAGLLMLEELESAKKRGATIYGEIAGYGCTCDAYHMTSPSPGGAIGAKAMMQAINDAGITPSEIDYINAHGTSTPINDAYETEAIKSVLGENAYNVPVSSSKSMTGHLIGAAGGVEAIITLKALEDGFVPPTIGFKEKDETCDLNYVTNGGYDAELTYALSNSLGFGGHNGVLCFKKWNG